MIGATYASIASLLLATAAQTGMTVVVERITVPTLYISENYTSPKALRRLRVIEQSMVRYWILLKRTEPHGATVTSGLNSGESRKQDYG